MDFPDDAHDDDAKKRDKPGQDTSDGGEVDPRATGAAPDSRQGETFDVPPAVLHGPALWPVERLDDVNSPPRDEAISELPDPQQSYVGDIPEPDDVGRLLKTFAADVEAPLQPGFVDADQTETTPASRVWWDSFRSNAASEDRPVASDLVQRPGEPVHIEVGPYDPRRDPPCIELLSQSAEREVDGPAAPTSNREPRLPGLLSPTSDGGPPLARPIIIVRLSDDQLRLAREEALLDAARRDAQVCEEIAQKKCRDLLYSLHTEERRLNPNLR